MKKFLALLLVMLMAFSLLAACSKKDEPAANNSTTTNETENKDNEAENKDGDDENKEGETETRKFIIGTVGGGLPYSLLEDDGTWTGVEGELWDSILERTGWEVEVKRCSDMTSLFGELDSGRIDVAANCAAITESRLEAHIASDPIYGDAQVIIVKPDSEYQTFEDLRGQVIGCTAGQAAQNTVEKMAPDYDWEVVPYENGAAGFQDANLGRIPAFANTTSAVEKYIREQGMEFRILDEWLFGNNVGWWFRDDAESAELRDAINEVLAEMHKDGTTAKITEKYFYKDMTQFMSDKWLTSTH